MAEDRGLSERLKRANEELRISPEVRDRHRLAIMAELDGPSIVTARRPAREHRPRRMALVAATLLIGPIGVLFASSGAVPGDTLYSTKRTVEQVVSVFDDELSAGNRLDELGELIERDAAPVVITKAQDDAFSALRDFEADHRYFHEYEDLVLGARRGSEGLASGYVYEGEVEWATGERYVVSLPDGEILVIEQFDSSLGVSVSGDWMVDRVADGRWFVSDRGIDPEVGDSTIFELEVIGNQVRSSLLDEPPVVAAPEQLVKETARNPEREPEPKRQEAVETEPGDELDEDEPQTAEAPSTTAVPRATSTAKPTTTVKPTTTAAPTTTRPAPNTTATTVPTTTATTAPPATTIPPPPTTVATTAPPTTICEDDDDVELDEVDDDECDD